MYIQTPLNRFDNLLDFDYSPKYVSSLSSANGMKLAYIDIGENINGIALCLHGNPTWGYMYRHAIPKLVNLGFRVIVPDLIGFGRSDKPLDYQWHTCERHHDILNSFIEYLSLDNILLVCHDWGGLLGLTLVPQIPNKVTKLFITNTLIPSTRITEDWFKKWDKWIEDTRDENNLSLASIFLPNGFFGPVGSMQEVLTKKELQGFIAPYPGPEYKAAFKAFPILLSNDPDSYIMKQGNQALEFFSNSWSGQCFIAAGTRDPFFYSTTVDLHTIIRNSSEPYLVDSGHWIFDYTEQIIDQMADYFRLNNK